MSSHIDYRKFLVPVEENPQSYQGKDYGFGLRQDKSNKGLGYFGKIPINDTDFMTELGSEAEIGGKHVHFPLLVPTLDSEEIEHLRKGGKVTEKIKEKSQRWAEKRISEGKSPFALPEEEGKTPLPGYNYRDYLKPIEEEPQRSFGEKAARLGSQAAIGAIQRATFPYDISTIVSQKMGAGMAPQEYRQQIFSDIEDLLQKKQSGQWSDADQQQYAHLVDLIQHPEKTEQFTNKEFPSIDVGSLIESGAKKLGVDLAPQDISEMAMRWVGFIKNPEKAAELMQKGMNPSNAKDILKALAPSPKEIARGYTASAALQAAADMELGPIGTMAAAVIGDMAPSLALKAGKAALHPVETTKRATAKTIAFLTPRDKTALQQSLIQDFKDAGIQPDVGTVTGSNVLKWIQSTLAQSSLTGQPLEAFKESLLKNVATEYQKLANQVGSVVHDSQYSAGEALKNGLKEARDIDIAESRELYNSAKERGGANTVYTGNIVNLIQKLQSELKPGSLKSPEQSTVMDILKKVQDDVMTPEGGIKSAQIQELINDKIALNDIIDYEVQGGAKKLLGQVVKEIDNAIASHGKVDPQFGREWEMANAKFKKHAELFRGKAINDALRTQDPSLIFNKMNTPYGIKEIEKALSKTPQGRELYKQLAAYKLQEMIGKNLGEGATNQMSLGKFSKLLEKGQNRKIVEALLGKESLKKLEAIQKSAGILAETAQKFLNTSRSGTHAADLAFAGKIVHDVYSFFAGNPWPIMKTGSVLLASKKLAKWMADPEFINAVEDIILESKKGSETALQAAGRKLVNIAKKIDVPTRAAFENVPSQEPNQ